jgi:hypothetical protein
VTVQQQDATGAAAIAVSAAPVMFQSSPTTISGLKFFTSTTCSGASVASASIAAGASAVTVYAQAWTGTAYQLTASSGSLTPAMQAYTVRPVVRSAMCLLDSFTGSRGCPVSPPYQVNTANTALFIQAASATASLPQAAVRCDVGTTSHVCRRRAAGSDARVWWQSVELDTGLNVQTATVACPNDGGTIAFQPFSNSTATGAFVLASQSTDTAQLDGTSLFTATRVAGGVNVEWSQPCTMSAQNAYLVSLQLVTLTGATSQPASGALTLGSASTQVPLTAAVGTPFVLAMHQLKPGGANDELCSRAVRAESTSSGLTFTRGASGTPPSSCTDEEVPKASAERVTLGAVGSVDVYTTTMAQGDLSATVMLPSPVDVTRTLVISSSQLAGAGQGAGESALSSGNVLGDTVAMHVLDAGTDFSSTQLFLIRGSAQAAGKWTSYVVTFGP